MKPERVLAGYRHLRELPFWRLLASDKAPPFIALLQSELYEEHKILPASIFVEKIERGLEELRAVGEDLPQPAQAYIANWLAEGYIERRFPTGAAEEEFELSTSAAEVLRFLSTIEQPYSSATESRLALVISALVNLAEQTDGDRNRRVERLFGERARIDAQIDSALKGDIKVLADDAALERAREIIGLAENLISDFRRVRDQFDRLNRELREQLLESEGRRGDVVEALFAGIDLISDSDAGRTFSAFWRLLTDPEQSTLLDEALDTILARTFSGHLDQRRRTFLRHLTRSLLDQGGAVHEVLQNLARSLKHFVQSREFLEQRRLNQLLREAQQRALGLKDEVKATDPLGFTLQLTTSHLSSVSQWQLYDPSLNTFSAGMQQGDALEIDIDCVGQLIAQSEINFRILQENVRCVLAEQSQASISEVLDRFPAEQGLGSIVGLVALASRHGIRGRRQEVVMWTGSDEEVRAARIPIMYFLRERLGELT